MANKDFETVSENWNRLGAINPLWAILTSDENWDMEVFLKTGEQEIDRRIKQVQEFHPIDVGRALDFGCGVGRLTQPLAKHFEQVDGVDVAQTMIDIARDINRFEGRCTYHHNEKSDLTLFPDDTFDLINSSLVLQHIPRPASLNYIREFMRVLKPGGLAFFQVVNTCGTASNNIQQQYPVLPSHAFNAQLTVLNLPAKMTSNRTYEVMVRVKNLSNYNKPDGDDTPLTPAEHDGVIWHGATFIRAKRSIKLGNHWWDESGRPVRY
ncbi:MAG: class I SAM-dependent methyltransferase, partial [Chloroflexota bacterium]